MATASSMQRIVFATDGSASAEAALAFANALNWPPGASIWVTSVLDHLVPSEQTASRLEAKGVAEWRRVLKFVNDDARARAGGVVSDAARRLRERHPGVEVKEVVRIGEPAAELLAHIDEVDAELVIAGARGHTVLHGLLLGSISEALVTSAPCPVLIVREAPVSIETVLVAVRTGQDADRLAELCLRLPLPPNARLEAVTVSAPLSLPQSGHHPLPADRLDHVLDAWTEEDRVEAQAVGHRFVEHIKAGEPGRLADSRMIRGIVNPTFFDVRGDVAPAIVREAEARNAALTIVGSRESDGFPARLGLGSVSRKLVRRAPGAILVLRESADRHRDLVSPPLRRTS